MEKKRVIVYVDGYNFYYGLKHGGSKWKRLYWLDVVKFFERMMLPDQELIEVNYYSARPVDDPQAYYNQDKLFHANELNPKFKLHLGLYKKKKIKCQNCGFKIKTYEEKESDVRVATGMLTDVFTKRCDITIVVSADSDMIPSVEIIKNFVPEHPVHVFVPPTQIIISVSKAVRQSKATAYARNKYICETADKILFVGVTEKSSLYPLKDIYKSKHIS